MPYLVVMNGPQKGRRLAITGITTRIGRVVGNHIVLDNVSVSSEHAEIARKEDLFRLRDLDSTNGTRVNGHRVTDTLLFRDDAVSFGDLSTVFSGDDAPVRQGQNATSDMPTETKSLPISRPQLTIASSASGKHATVSMPPDFRKRMDARIIWVAVIAMLLVGIGFGVWKFYHSLFSKGLP
ncbi:MAG: FHA domain-containing protein [bacterium]